MHTAGYTAPAALSGAQRTLRAALLCTDSKALEPGGRSLHLGQGRRTYAPGSSHCSGARGDSTYLRAPSRAAEHGRLSPTKLSTNKKNKLPNKQKQANNQTNYQPNKHRAGSVRCRRFPRLRGAWLVPGRSGRFAVLLRVCARCMRCATCDMRHATCNLQRATCDSSSAGRSRAIVRCRCDEVAAVANLPSRGSNGRTAYCRVLLRATQGMGHSAPIAAHSCSRASFGIAAWCALHVRRRRVACCSHDG